MKLSEKQTEILEAEGHLLVIGGPGAGKTTISILKAAKIAASLRPGQEVLFLSFARATISRVIEAIEYEHDIPKAIKSRISVETYHSFFWRVLQTHGYLLGLPRSLTILTPANEAIALSAIRSDYKAEGKLSEAEKAEKKGKEQAERLRLAKVEGRLCFDLFAGHVAELLERSKRLRQLIAGRYPVIILDEFQDTNADQWRVVQQLGREGILIALADPEQRIYDWIGADPARLDQFRATFEHTEIVLQSENHRSAGTEILLFGNEILTGKFSKKQYLGIEIKLYPANENEASTALLTQSYAARKRLVDSKKKDWSLAILVPTKKMTRAVSDMFRQPLAKMSPIRHSAAVDLDGAILGAEIVSFMLQPPSLFHVDGVIDLLCNYYHGKGGDSPTKSDLQQAVSIRKAFALYVEKKAAGKPLPKNSLMVSLLQTYEQLRAIPLTGDPDQDWRAARKAMENGACVRLKEVAVEVKNIRLLERGTQLRQELSQDWRTFGRYENALEITRQAFVREHFATQANPETGVIVMNMHKAKGKQFDEVIIFEGWPRYVKKQIVANPDRIVRANLKENIDVQARQNLRVSITRGKQRTTILTPREDPCVIFI
ncbi:ATP-dependent helicase [Burkholderia multivorans]|nr:ATP-dependent helicase [Burkholderia multivorans]MBU9205479.1 ATP-dependent helicase [Burkholderia multivorans]MCO8353489.1 ATP-dependent helicase [Burkholderia multivorans]MCO8385748.1 ATP-dependent helicase [Burkholderia multivorans]MCO8406571.1 ATP-dependent helicase [Burkholderia multivorans]MCO8434844.1 ATP-dependent helicase [Burkholderia multivorans]